MYDLSGLRAGALCAGLATAVLLGVSFTSQEGGGSRIRLVDRVGDTASVLIRGIGADGRVVDVCWRTPGEEAYVHDTWWRGEVELRFFTAEDCSRESESGAVLEDLSVVRDGGWTTVTSS
ncbi:hypothetical protein [Streptomyces sp. NPDC097619]|uniref:hypothetical protein n=1 Tax=Streptomyces sp. NPDC097619 TaxID=3157228 RepID=UPI00331D295E